MTIRPRPGILNPEGQTIERALGDLGYSGIEEVRVGRMIGLRIEADDLTSCEQQVREACQRLLANPVIEDFEFTVSESADQPAVAK
ncbi:MAG: phosphoribosylformylglycinamidine synthase subunit PurS [Gemmatimonadota bacterium]